jgi:hypothetical protein
MKNIYVLPTDKPSRLYLWKDKLRIGTLKTSPISIGIVDQHIYITNSEEIKEGDWVLNIEENTIFKPSNDEIYDIKNSEAKYYEYCKKVILTTDQDLIKDGVQAIDDDFLEWFVAYPSCEEVKIEGHIYKGQDETEYKIIIPQEEQIKCYCGHTSYCDCGPQEEANQEQKQHLIAMRLDEDVVIAPACVGQSRLHEQDTVGKEFYESADKTITVYRQETFIKTDNVDGQWLSPVPTERAWQEEKLVEIFGHFPTASPRWQYMNGLIQNSLDAKQMYSEEELRNAMNWMMTQYFEFYECPTTSRVNHYIQTIKQQEQ